MICRWCRVSLDRIPFRMWDGKPECKSLFACAKRIRKAARVQQVRPA